MLAMTVMMAAKFLNALLNYQNMMTSSKALYKRYGWSTMRNTVYVRKNTTWLTVARQLFYCSFEKADLKFKKIVLISHSSEMLPMLVMP